ncbi:MAG: M23 family metallopeptidase [Saprospiraceae bacterium]|nr:M23 family metallopeptidase [Saprospiraceae bacterium]
MKHLYLIFSILFLTFFFDPNDDASTGSVPPQYPQGYFASPIGGDLVLSGSFGELRKNHFHAGIDIAPTRGGNEPIFAAAEGYISRIKIQEAGYGQALYVTHPNGYTTVYAHLHSLSSDILAFLRKKQYETETFEQDLTLQPTDFPVKQGQQIATMGNRGMSKGQHLHFEIRETQTEKAVNPLLFGLSLPDKVPPKFEDLKIYFLNEKKEVVGSRIVNLRKKTPLLYGVEGDTLDVWSPYVAFAIQATDIHGEESGENGIYSLSLKSNDELIYQFKAEKFGFDETRYINAHTDYQEQTVRNAFFHRAFRLCGDYLSMYDSMRNDGIIMVQPEVNEVSGAKKIQLVASDIVGNTRELSFAIRAKAALVTSEPKPYTYFFPFDKESVIKPDESAIFYFPKGCFYENIYARFNATTATDRQYSKIYQLHEARTPVHSEFNIAIKPNNMPDSLRSKACIVYSAVVGGQAVNCGGVWDSNGFLTTKYNRLGCYSISYDQMPPTISPESFAEKMTPSSMLSFRLSDNLEGQPIRYRAEMDGKWFLMEFDTKSSLLFCRLKDLPVEMITEGGHDLKVTATDSRGNETVFKRRLEIVDHIEKPKPKPQTKKRKK